MEISAKVDIAKSALRERAQGSDSWLVDLLDSIQADLHTVSPKAAAAATAAPNRSPANLSRPQQRPDENTATAGGSETGASSAA
jgi:hypothetical protein